MEYWNDLIVERSWKILWKLKGKFEFILIGGWANYLWTKKFKSKDIDIIVNFETLAKLKKYYDLKKNENLKRYEIRIDEVDIDIYVAFYSKLTIPLELVRKTKIEGFDVIQIEDLLVLNQGAEIDRKESEKGEKDRLDVLSLLFYCDVDFEKYCEILKKIKKENYSDLLIRIIKNFKEYRYFEMTPRELKQKKEELLRKLKKVY
ncbi:MAG: hypothetical protein ABIB47_02100 [Candidatus Woesearchaeota archaeon]